MPDSHHHPVNEEEHRIIISRIGKLETEAGIHSVKLDNLQGTMDKLTVGLAKRVETHGKTIATQGADLSNAYKYIEAVSKKTDQHIEGHWKWITIMVGLITMGGLVFNFVRP